MNKATAFLPNFSFAKNSISAARPFARLSPNSYRTGSGNSQRQRYVCDKRTGAPLRSAFHADDLFFLNLNSYEQIDLKSIKHVESDAELDAVFGLVGKKHPGYWLATWPVVYEGKTHGWCSSYIPVPLFPDLAQAVAAGKRMVDIKSNKYAFLPVKGAVAVLARPAKNKVAQLLEVPRRSFVLIAEGGLYARNGSIVEYIRTAMRPDLIKLEIS